MKTIRSFIRDFFPILAFTIIASLFFVFGLSVPVHAMAVPEIASTTFEVIENAESTIHSSMLTPFGLFPEEISSIRDVVRDLLGLDPFLKPNDFTVRQLTEIEKENLAEGYRRLFYDMDGNEISYDDLYYCEGNNGYAHCEFYMDSDGNVLFESPDNDHELMNLGLRNDAFFGTADGNWQNVYQLMAQRINNGNLNYFPDITNATAATYFLWVGETSGGRPSKSGYIYINNQNIPGKIVPVNTSGQIWHWYTNDLSLIQSVTTMGNFTPSTYSSGNYVYNGFNYRYYVTGMNPAGLPAPINYSDWLNGTFGRCFGKQGTLYADLPSVANSIGFKKVREVETPVISPNELYDYNELQNLQPGSTVDPNPNFNPSSPITPNNYPFENPFPNTVINPSDLPLPGSDPGLDPDPAPGEDIGDIGNGSTIPENIPILSNLKNRFPFCIPFDIYRLAKGLSVQRETPYIDTILVIPGINYSWHIQLDLHMWDDTAELFRLLELILFIVGLAYFSYSHFFGT